MFYPIAIAIHNVTTQYNEILTINRWGDVNEILEFVYRWEESSSALRS
jgi:hypothetical protein